MSTGFFNLGFGRLGKLRGGNLDSAGQFAIAQNFHSLLAGTDEAGGSKRECRYFRDGGIQAGEIADIEDGDFGTEIELIESAVRELAVKGHLAAFEAGTNGATGASGLAFATATGRFTVAAAFAAAAPSGLRHDPVAALLRAGAWIALVVAQVQRPGTTAAVAEEVEESDVAAAASAQCSRCRSGRVLAAVLSQA